MKKLGILLWNILGMSMAFVNRTANDYGRVFEQLTLVDTATVYSSVISAIKVKSGKNSPDKQYVTFTFQASGVAGTDLDIALMGSDTLAGTKFLLKDAIVADILTGVTTRVAGVLDMQAYPASFYWIRVITDADESGNTLDINISGDLNGSQ